MAYRKTKKSSDAFNPHDYIPLWNQQHSDATHLMTQALFARLGITDARSYFARLLMPIVICVLVGAVYGAVINGFWGFVWGLLAGVVAPAALVLLGIVVCYSAVILGVFFAAWAAIIFGFFWLVGR